MKGGLCLGSSASLPAQTVSREHMPDTKILYPSKSVVFKSNVMIMMMIKRTLMRLRNNDDDEDEDNDDDDDDDVPLQV